MFNKIAEIFKRKAVKKGLNKLHKFELNMLYIYELIKDGCNKKFIWECITNAPQLEFIKKQLNETFEYEY